MSICKGGKKEFDNYIYEFVGIFSKVYSEGEEKRLHIYYIINRKADRNAYKESVLKLLLKDTNGGKLYKYRRTLQN